MIREHISNAHFDFTMAFLGKPDFTSNTIRVPVRIFGITAGYPGITRDTYYERCTLLYDGVSASQRTILKYLKYNAHEKSGFAPEIKRVDSEFSESGTDEKSYVFYLGTVSEDLRAWVEWEIIAKSVSIIDEILLKVNYRQE
ncbi:MAG: hypothetical protein SF123_17865 [Chloroflexota bacterium]|nr:hypothetical protein [Chloroflexota bacterium]